MAGSQRHARSVLSKVHAASGRARAGAVEVCALHRGRGGLLDESDAARPCAERDERLAEGVDSLILADAADRGMAVEHLLEERGAGAGESDDQRDAVHGICARGDPLCACACLRGVLARRLQEALEVEARRGLGVEAGREVERLAMAARLVEQADGVEAGDAAQDGTRGARGDGRERRDGAGRVVGRREPRAHERGARVGGPRAARREESREFIAPVREPIDLCERDRGLECLRCARGRHAREPGDGAVDSAEALLDHSAEELRLRIIRSEPERRIEVGRCRRALGHARRIRAEDSGGRDGRDDTSSAPNAHRPRVGGGGVKSVGS